MFEHFDLDGNGTLCANELPGGEYALNEYDTDKSGVIELDEFIKGTCQYLWDYERVGVDRSLIY